MSGVGVRSKYNVRGTFKLLKTVAGSKDHCCVPKCSASSRHNSVLSFHRFPREASLCAKWLHRIQRAEFTVTQNTKVCSRHFEEHLIRTTAKGRRVLSRNAVPSLFHWNDYAVKRRARVWERRTKPSSPEPELEDIEDEDIEDEAVPMEHEARPTVVDREEYERMKAEIETLREQVQTLHLNNSFGLQRFASSSEDIRFYTRFPSYKHLMAFWSLIESATFKMIRVTSRAKRASSTSTVTESPVNRPTKLLAIDELFLFLTYLSTGCTQRELAHRFKIHRTTVSRIIVTWANFLYTLLGSVCFWMSPAAVKDNLPPEFSAYSDTQVILDCTELRCQTHCTFKAMVGMSPHGALTFISTLFEGSMSDKEIFRQSGIKNLLTPDTAIMVDKGFLVDDLAPGTVYRPAFVIQRAQMAEADVLETQSIARLRVHVERLIRRVKENKLFENTIPLSISGSINQIFTVACLLSNFQNGPLVKTWANEI